MRKVFCVVLIAVVVFAGTIISHANGNIDDSVWRVRIFDGGYIEYNLNNGKYSEKLSSGETKTGTYQRNGDTIKFSDGQQWLVTEDYMYQLNSVISNVSIGVAGTAIDFIRQSDNKAFMVEFTKSGTYRMYVKLLGKWETFISCPYIKMGYDFYVGAYQEHLVYDNTTRRLYSVVARRQKNWVTVNVSGNELNFDTDPQIINSRVMVPMRVIFETLGAEVSWDASTKTVTGSYGETVIKLPIGSNTATIGEDKINLDSPACIVKGRTLVPVRFVAEAMGSTVNWDSSSKTVSISRANPEVKYRDKINAFLDLYSGHDMINMSTNVPFDYEGFAYTCGSASLHYGKKIIIGTIDNYEPNAILAAFDVKNPEAFDESKTKQYWQGDLTCHSANVVMILYVDDQMAHIVDILYLDDKDAQATGAKEFETELRMTAGLKYSKDEKTVYINIETEEGSEVTVNGEKLKLSKLYYDEFFEEYREGPDGYEYGEYVYEFGEGGSKNFVIEGKKPNKSKKITLTAEYDTSGPDLTIDDLPEETTKPEIIVSGEVWDGDDYVSNVSVTINGENVYVPNNGKWHKVVKLQEGKNTLEIVAENAQGYTTKETIRITYTPEPEEI